MTLIVGIKCQKGIALAADGAATLGTAGQMTVRQPVTKKLVRIREKMVLGVSGAVGLAQRFEAVLSEMWDKKMLSRRASGSSDEKKAGDPAILGAIIRQQLWTHIDYEMKVATVAAPMLGEACRGPAMSHTLLALPFGTELCLMQFDPQAAPELASNDLPFIAIGSGQRIADPFLAFLRRIYFPDRLPNVSEGILFALWTVQHAIDTNPGGVSNPIQVIRMEMTGQDVTIAELTQSEINGEHLEAIKKVECKMATLFSDDEHEATTTEEPADVPPLPSPPV